MKWHKSHDLDDEAFFWGMAEDLNGPDGLPICEVCDEITDVYEVSVVWRGASETARRTDAAAEHPGAPSPVSTEDSMDPEIRKRMCAALGLAEDCTDDDLMAAVEAVCKRAAEAESDAEKAKRKCSAAEGESSEAKSTVSRLTAALGKPDAIAAEAEIVRLRAEFVPRAELAAAQAEIDRLKAGDPIGDALRDGRISSAQAETLRGMGVSAAAMQSYLSTLTPGSAVPMGLQAAGHAPANVVETKADGLTDRQKSVAQRLGISEAAYADTLKRNRERLG